MLFKRIARPSRRYSHVFFDLDRTLWDLERNTEATLLDLFHRFGLQAAIGSAADFQAAFTRNNDRLWLAYRQGRIRKEVLRIARFDITLRGFGITNKELAQAMGWEYIRQSPTRTALFPHTTEVLDYLKQRYRLHIITNGFNEVQFRKLRSCGIEGYFERVVTSEMSGYHKPRPEAFAHSLRVANAEKCESIMIGDDLEADILGAKHFGLDQVFFNPKGVAHRAQVTHEIRSLLELKTIL